MFNREAVDNYFIHDNNYLNKKSVLIIKCILTHFYECMNYNSL